MQLPQFGKAPKGERLKQIKASKNFTANKFRNQSFTPELTEGHSMFGVIFDNFFQKAPRKRPTSVIPSQKTKLFNLPIDQEVLVWFGHSSYYMQLGGKRILVDPVFSGHASPIPGTYKSFKGTDIYTADDLPTIDYLFITHDHYDHLDYKTITTLRPKVQKVICGLGVGSHFEAWGYNPTKVVEKDWYDSLRIDDNFSIHVTPARHFSGRGFSRNNTLWCSFVLQTPNIKIYIGGDSGYDSHFAEIGNNFGPIDLAILDNGQYDVAWKYIHTLPDEVLKAASDLKAKRVFPVHSGKFVLANHPWDEPLDTISKLYNKNLHCPIITPMIGETVYLDSTSQKFSEWWKKLK